MTLTTRVNISSARHDRKYEKRGTGGGALVEFYNEDIEKKKSPNRLSPIGAHRDLKALLDTAKKGKRTFRAQKFDIQHSIVDGDSVALEVFWSGYLATPVDTLPADSEMRAHLSIWLEFRDGKISRQHNYDCFDPWWV